MSRHPTRRHQPRNLQARVDGYKTFPMVVLPEMTTREQLARVLEACPPLEPGWGGGKEGDDPWGMMPSIGFSAPGYDGKPPTVEISEERQGNLNELIRMIYAPDIELDKQGH